MLDKGNLPAHVKEKVVNWINHGKANKTWSTYQTAERMAHQCQKDYKTSFDWPMTADNTLLFIYWLVEERGLKASTANSYLSGLRQLHIMKGLPPPKLRSELVKQALKGRANMETSQENGETPSGSKRLPMTIPLLKLLKERIRTSDLAGETKLMLWSACSLMFFGAFRINELVSKSESCFDPDHTLLTRDVQLNETATSSSLTVTIKCPKESRAGEKAVVDVFEAEGPLCPIRAFKKWRRSCQQQWDMPLFRHPDGTPLTCRKFNWYLKKMLGRHAQFAQGTVSAHSFRAGIATILGTKGYDDEEIKRVGRWSSRAFEIYIKGKRTNRAAMARRFGDLVDS